MANIVLLHGFCERKAMWESTVESLGDTHRYLVLDLPGFGANNASCKSITDMAKYVFDEMRVAGMTNAILVGHSMGGYVALELAKLRPSVVDGIALVHSHAAADDANKKQNRTKLVDFLSRNTAHDFLKPFAKDLVAAPNQSNKQLINQVWDLVKDTQKEGIIQAAIAMRNRTDNNMLLSQFEGPILWVVGQYDQFMSQDEILGQVAL